MPEEFSFQECLIFLNRSPLESTYQVLGNQVTKFLNLNDEPVLFTVKPHGRGEICISFSGNQPSESVCLMVKEYVRSWLDLDRDLKPFYKLAEKSYLLGSLAQAYYGLRLIGIPDLFEALAWAVIGQQINLNFAYTLKKRLVENFGERYCDSQSVFWCFPYSQIIAELKPEYLRELQFSKSKAEYVIGIARLIASGEISREKILQKKDDVHGMRELLLSVRGVGEWTADYVLMKCFQIPSAFPITDVGLHNAIRLQLNLSEKPSLAEIRKLAGHWINWEAYATFYLWRSLI